MGKERDVGNGDWRSWCGSFREMIEERERMIWGKGTGAKIEGRLATIRKVLTDLDRFAEACQAIFSTKVDIDPARTWVVV